MNNISLGLHKENFVIEQPNIDGIRPIASSEEAVISARSPAAKRKAKSTSTTTTAMPAKKQATAAVGSEEPEPAYVQELTQATTALSIGDRLGYASLLRRYKDNGLSPMQWGGHVEFTGLHGPSLIGAWK